MVDNLPSVDSDAGKIETTPVRMFGGDGLPILLASDTFGPQSATFTGPNQQMVLPCAGAASILFELSGTFTGSIASANSADTSLSVVSPSRLWMTGVGSLGRSSIVGTGSLQVAEYRAVAGGSVYVLTSSADFAGLATITAFATQACPIGFTHGAVHGSDEEALRAGRAYSISSGAGTVASGNSMVLYVQNPAGSGVRIFIPHRLFTSSRIDAIFGGISNPTSGLPATAVTASNRGQGSASAIVGRANVFNAANLSALAASGTMAPSNVLGGGAIDLTFERTLEPGQAFANYITNTTSGGLGNAADMLASITFAFFQEPL